MARSQNSDLFQQHPWAESTVADGKVKHLRPVLIFSSWLEWLCVLWDPQGKEKLQDRNTNNEDRNQQRQTPRLGKKKQPKKQNKLNLQWLSVKFKFHPQPIPLEREWWSGGRLDYWTRWGMIIGKQGCVDPHGEWRQASVSWHGLGTRRNWRQQTIYETTERFGESDIEKGWRRRRKKTWLRMTASWKIWDEDSDAREQCHNHLFDLFPFHNKSLSSFPSLPSSPFVSPPLSITITITISISIPLSLSLSPTGFQLQRQSSIWSIMDAAVSYTAGAGPVH